MFDYFWDGDSCKWIPWTDKVPEYVHAPEAKFHKILVPTVDTVRTTWLLGLQVDNLPLLPLPLPLALGQASWPKAISVQSNMHSHCTKML